MVNWPVAIERNRDALLRIVAMLFAIAGLDENTTTATLPRHLRFYLIRILRPAESALRRLVIIAARGLTVEIPGRCAAGERQGREESHRHRRARADRPRPCLRGRPADCGR